MAEGPTTKKMVSHPFDNCFLCAMPVLSTLQMLTHVNFKALMMWAQLLSSFLIVPMRKLRPAMAK